MAGCTDTPAHCLLPLLLQLQQQQQQQQQQSVEQQRPQAGMTGVTGLCRCLCSSGQQQQLLLFVLERILRGSV